MINRFICAGLLPLMLSACVFRPGPHEQLRLTEQALSQAAALGLSTEQSPALHLAKQVRVGSSGHAEEDYKQARVHAEQAELDARLAEAQYLSAKSQQQLGALNNAPLTACVHSWGMQ